MFDPLLGADAAAHFNVQPALAGQRLDHVPVGQSAVLGAVQVHHMEVFGPGGLEGPGLGAGIGPVDRHPVVVPLGQSDHLAAPQVNGWKKLHRIAPFLYTG